jgi:hypothetical protein
MTAYNLPKGYEKNKGIMRPAYLRGYGHFIYFNLDEIITDADFSNWIIGLFDEQGNQVIAEIGTLQKDVVSVSGYRFYLPFTIDGATPKGTYQMVIHNNVIPALKYDSNWFEVITSDDIENYMLLFYRNSSNAFSFNYQGVNNYNTIFLPMNIIDQQPEINLTAYRERTTGIIRNQKSQTAKVISIESYFFDDEANDMMLALSIHDDILINGQSFQVKTAYKIEYDKNASMHKGVIEMYNQKFSTINLNGN